MLTPFDERNGTAATRPATTAALDHRAGDPVRFSVLGPLLAWRGPDEVDLGPPQQRAILALLLVRADRLVSIDDMVDLLWEQNPPASAVNAIHKYIGGIRRLLEPHLPTRNTGRWLTRHGGTYRLALAEDMSDLTVFRRLVRDACAAGGSAHALDLLTTALALGRGTCGEGLELHGRGRDHFAAVDREYIAALTDAADTALACAQAASVLPRLRQAAYDEPLNESLQARLMLVLAAAGQQAQALSHYQRVRDQLKTELGVDIGTEMRAAHSRVLRQQFSTGTDERPRIQTHGQVGAQGTPALPEQSHEPDGAARENLLATGSDPRDAWTIRALGAPLVRPAQLPAALPAFVGRERELAALTEALTDRTTSPGAVPSCVVSGTPGIGKTALAVHWAHLAAKHFPDGQLFLDLHGFDAGARPTTPTEALHLLLSSLGLPAELLPGSLDALAAAYRSVLADKSVLIVLDNARDIEQVRPLLPGSQGCRVVVTSRNPMTGLAVAHGARLLRLDPFPPATAADALRLRLGAARVDAEPAVVEAIIQFSGRLPLALALVATRAAAHPDFGLAAIAQELRRTRGGRGHLGVFGAAGDGADAETAFSASYRVLSPPARRLFRLLSLRPATGVTAGAVADLFGITPEEANRLIGELTGTSLFAEDRPGLYTCHPLVGIYAAELSEHTDSEGDRHETTARLLRHHLRAEPAARPVVKPSAIPADAVPHRIVSPGVLESAAAWSLAAADHGPAVDDDPGPGGAETGSAWPTAGARY